MTAGATAERGLSSLLRLVLVTDEVLAAPRGGVETVVAKALTAGCRSVQLRMKGAGAAEMLRAARPLRRMTAEAGALLFVNDRLDVALALRADGVHLGPDDLPVAAAAAAIERHEASEARVAEGASTAAGIRGRVASRCLVGYSTDVPEEARRAVADGADYIGCGAVYPTSSKDDAGTVIGLEGLSAVVEAVDVPVVAIGGITPERAADCAATGASGVAVISAVMAAERPEKAVRRLLEAFGSGASSEGG